MKEQTFINKTIHNFTFKCKNMGNKHAQLNTDK